MKKYCLLIFIFLFIFTPECFCSRGAISGNDYEVTAQFMQKKAAPGEIVNLHLNFKIPSGFTLSDNAEITGLNNYDIVGKKNLAKGISIDIFVDRMEDINLPPLEICLYDKDGKQKMLKSNPLVLPVEPLVKVKPGENLLRPAKSIISSGHGIKKVLLIVFLIIVIILVVIAAYYFIKYFKSKKSGPGAPALPPHLHAFNRIDGLLLSGIPDGDKKRGFCFILSEILREYMGGIRAFNPLEMTTHEISGVVKEKADLELLNILKKMDMVKFADTFISASNLEEQIELSREYINRTKPKEI